jgi:hypothetical protein
MVEPTSQGEPSGKQVFEWDTATLDTRERSWKKGSGARRFLPGTLASSSHPDGLRESTFSVLLDVLNLPSVYSKLGVLLEIPAERRGCLQVTFIIDLHLVLDFDLAVVNANRINRNLST